MRIGIIGAGDIGTTLARHLAKAGHSVALSNSRGPASLATLVKSLGPNTRALTADDAARFGEIVILAVPWRKPEALPSPDAVSGKVVVDAMNPYSTQGEVIELGEETSSEIVARRLPGARLIKAFNTMYYRTLLTEARPPGSERLALFLAGDDAQAKALVARLVDEIGFTPVDTGSLREGGCKQQPGSPIYNRPLTLTQAKDALREMARS